MKLTQKAETFLKGNADFSMNETAFGALRIDPKNARTQLLPNKILAVRTERRLLEESRYKVVVFDVVNILLFERAFAAPQLEAEFRVQIVGIVDAVVHHLGHRLAARSTVYRRRSADNRYGRSPNVH